jgi:transposase
MKIVGAGGYGIELRERIVEFVNEGHTPGAAAAHFKVHVQTVQQYLEKAAQGTLAVVGKPTGRPFELTTIHEAQLLKQLDEHGDATLLEHARMLEAATGLQVSFKTVDRAFRRHQITHNKNAGRQRTL